MTDTTKQTLSGILGVVVGVIGAVAMYLGLNMPNPDCIEQPPPPAITIVVTVIMPTATLTPEPTATATALPPILVTATAMAEAGELLPTATVQP